MGWEKARHGVDCARDVAVVQLLSARHIALHGNGQRGSAVVGDLGCDCDASKGSTASLGHGLAKVNKGGSEKRGVANILNTVQRFPNAIENLNVGLARMVRETEGLVHGRALQHPALGI